MFNSKVENYVSIEERKNIKHLIVEDQFCLLSQNVQMANAYFINSSKCFEMSSSKGNNKDKTCFNIPLGQIIGGFVGALLLIYFVYLIYCLFILDPDKIVLLNELKIIDKQTTTISVDPPIQRTQRWADLYVVLDNTLGENNRYEGMVVETKDGKKGRLNIELFCNSGSSFKANDLYYNPNSDTISINFKSDIPKKEKIFKIEVSSEVKLYVNNIYWFSYYPH